MLDMRAMSNSLRPGMLLLLVVALSSFSSDNDNVALAFIKPVQRRPGHLLSRKTNHLVRWYTENGSSNSASSSNTGESDDNSISNNDQNTLISASSQTISSTTVSAPSDVSITSPALEQAAPLLLAWRNTYGHPNIPLKNPGGNQCVTLRRLHIQNKLSEEEVEWLSSIGFRWHSLEDVYRHADFDDLFERLVAYEAAHPNNNFQVPKKLAEDPELGSWVTGLRRLGPQGVNPLHERRLNDIGFAWVSDRQCGSKFMLKYRELTERVEDEGLSEVMKDPETVPWVQAQQAVLKRGGLSQTRVHYMGQLFGEAWTTIGKDVGKDGAGNGGRTEGSSNNLGP